jgi:hypothetical protein
LCPTEPKRKPKANSDVRQARPTYTAAKQNLIPLGRIVPKVAYARSNVQPAGGDAKKKSPSRLWNYCAELKASIRSHTAHNLPILEDGVPDTLMTGSTADISQLVEFGWYDWVYLWDTSETYPDNKEILGRYLGPAPDIGPAMAARILKENGEVVVRTTLRSLLPEEILREKEKEERTRFDKAIYARWGPASKPGDFEDDLDIETPSFEPYSDDENAPHTIPEADEHDDPDKYDKYLNREVTLPHGNIMTAGRVVYNDCGESGIP